MQACYLAGGLCFLMCIKTYVLVCWSTFGQCYIGTKMLTAVIYLTVT